MAAIDKQNKTPIIIATGFTPAFLGDERTLREFIVGDHIQRQQLQNGENAILYLINDTYDPLNYRQLRIGVNKREDLIDKFEKYVGQPIAEIPDPFNCHASYAEHFTHCLHNRLRDLNIMPFFMDTYNSYKGQHYKKYTQIVFEQYNEIVKSIEEEFSSFGMQNLFRVQCDECMRMDMTEIKTINKTHIKYECKACDKVLTTDIGEVKGKLGWKIDCAARWNIYDIDIETFSKPHATNLGALDVSNLISEKFFGGKKPRPIKYGAVSISNEVSYKLLEILPPQLLKNIFTKKISRDIVINKETIKNFSSKYYIKPGMNYIDFVNRELPILAIEDTSYRENYAINGDAGDMHSLIECGNKYSEYYYNKYHNIILENLEHIFSSDKDVAKYALEIISYCLQIRKHYSDKNEVKTEIINFLRDKQDKSKVFPYLRLIFGQENGPVVSVLLTILPYDYLSIVAVILRFYVNNPGPEKLSLNI